MQNINILHHAFVRGNLLRKKFIVDAKGKDEQHDHRQHAGQVTAHPVVHLESLAGVCLCLEIAPAPAVSCNTEKQVYKRAKRQKYIAYKEILNVKNCASEDFKAAPIPDIVSQYARQ